MNDVVSLPQHIPTRKRRRASTITIQVEGDTHPVELAMADEMDWGIIFEDVLQVRAKDGITYHWPVANLKDWKVEVNGLKRKEEESD